MKRGYIKLWRKVQDSQSWSRSALHRALFVTLLVKANWETSWFRGEEVPAGSAAVTVRGLADELGTPSSSVFKALKDLEKDDVLSLCSVDRKWTLIKLNNWATYQHLESVQINTDCTLNGHSKEYKNIINNNTPVSSYEDTAPTAEPAEPKKAAKATRFTPPTVEEVAAYCHERKNGIDPQYFVDLYEANGWKRGKGIAVKDWKALVRTWERNQRQNAKYPNCPRCPDYSEWMRIYNQELPMLTPAKMWEKGRVKSTQETWEAMWESGKFRTTEGGIEFLHRYFSHVKDCPFLMGQIQPDPGKKPFFASFAWLIEPGNCAKVIDGIYERRDA